jgi:hypothetical protein
MMKILGSLLGLFMGSSSMLSRGLNIDFKGIQASVFDELAVRTRKPVMLVLLGFCAIIFFCAGSFMAILDATRQFDLTGTVVATATLWTGIGIAAVTLGGYIYIFMHEWPGLKEVNADKRAKEEAYERAQSQQYASSQPSDVEGAIAALVMDFVESRKNKREHRYTEREQRRSEREARRAERDAKRSGHETWTAADQNQSPLDPHRH